MHIAAGIKVGHPIPTRILMVDQWIRSAGGRSPDNAVARWNDKTGCRQIDPLLSDREVHPSDSLIEERQDFGMPTGFAVRRAARVGRELRTAAEGPLGSVEMEQRLSGAV